MAVFYRCDRCGNEMDICEATPVWLKNADRQDNWEICGACARALIKFLEKLVKPAEPQP